MELFKDKILNLDGRTQIAIKDNIEIINEDGVQMLSKCRYIG